MSVHVFKSFKDRRREVWPSDDAERFGLLAQFLNQKHIVSAMRCAQAGCPDRTLKAIRQADQTVLHCGCTDRVLTGVGAARG